MSECLIVIPTYNEKPNIEKLIPILIELDESIELLVVDDNSPDGTSMVVSSYMKRYSKVNLLTRRKKKGLARAYIEGFKWALSRKYSIIIQMDADFSHDPTDIPRLIKAIKEGSDVAVGSRYIGGVRIVGWDMKRLLLSIAGNLYAAWMTGVPVKDLTGGFNAWRREVLERINLNKIESDGYAFQIELKFLAYYMGFKISEIPIIFRERGEGISKMSRAVVREAVWRCLMWKSKLIFNKLRPKNEY